MQVKIDNECFFSEDNHENLDKIFDFFKSKRHIWLNMDLEYLEKTKWYQDLGARDRKYLKELFVGSTRPSSSYKTININDFKESDFNVLEATMFLEQPLTIIVENYEYEPVFINCIFKNFGTELIDAKYKHWLKFENGGGGSDNAVKGMLKEMFSDPSFTKSKDKYLRCYVIKDSDRKYCNIALDDTIIQQSLKPEKNSFLLEKNISHHILYKREKENYMPDSIFNNFLHKTKMKKAVKIYLTKLSPVQKDYFDLEKGFSERGRIKEIGTLEKPLQDFYENLSEKDYNDIGSGIPYPSFKSDFSKNFEHVHRDDLLKRINHQPLLKSEVNILDKKQLNEFEHIVREIKFLL